MGLRGRLVSFKAKGQSVRFRITGRKVTAKRIIKRQQELRKERIAETEQTIFAFQRLRIPFNKEQIKRRRALARRIPSNKDLQELQRKSSNSRRTRTRRISNNSADLNV